MNSNDYPFNLIRAIYGDSKDDNTHTQATYIKGLYEQLETLDRKEQMLLSIRFKEGLKLKECGERIDLSQGRTGLLIRRALRKLRHPSRSKHYETVTNDQMERFERKYRRIEKENEQIKEALQKLGSSDVDPHVVIQLASLVRPEHLTTRITELGLSTRSCNGLLRYGLFTVQDVISIPEEKLISMRSIGEKSVKEIKAKIRTHILLPDMYQDGQEVIT